MTQRPKSELKPLGALLESARLATVKAGGCSLTALEWGRAMGPRIAARSTPEQLRDGVLTLRVASAVWSQELSLLSHEIIQKLVTLGYQVQKIRCQVGPLPTGGLPKKPSRSARPLPDVPLPTELLATLSTIGDDELRQAVQAAAQNQLNLQAIREAQRRKAIPRREQLASNTQAAGLANARTQAARAPQSAGSRSAPPDQNEPASREERPHTRVPPRY